MHIPLAFYRIYLIWQYKTTFITRNVTEDLAVVSIETYDQIIGKQIEIIRFLYGPMDWMNSLRFGKLKD